MTRQKTPHTQSQQNTKAEQTDFEADQSLSGPDDQTYDQMEGAETGTNRSFSKVEMSAKRHQTEPEASAHEGSVSTRTPKRPNQGITSHSSAEESARQEKVVNDRPDARSGVNRSK